MRGPFGIIYVLALEGEAKRMSAQTAFDSQPAPAFARRVLDDTGGFAATVLAYMGDRLGLFRDLALQGPATSVELAARTHVDERYGREWLGCRADEAAEREQAGEREPAIAAL